MINTFVKRSICAMLLMCFFSFQSEKINEQTAKALFVYNFTKYIEWPVEKREAKFIIGIYGHSDILSELMNFTYGKMVDNKPIEVQLIKSEEHISSCNILYVPQSYSTEVKEIAEKTKNKGVLIITEKNGDCTKGSSINIIKKNNKLAFELSENSIKQSGLKVSEQLLNLAIVLK